MKTPVTVLRFRPTWPLLLLIFLFSACEKENFRTLDNPEPLPVKLGAFEIKDVYNGLERTYTLGIRRVQDHYVFCNFADLRIDVKFYLVDDQISIPAQQFAGDDPVIIDFEIFQGTGKTTSTGLEVTTWVRDGEQKFRYDMKAVIQN